MRRLSPARKHPACRYSRTCRLLHGRGTDAQSGTSSRAGVLNAARELILQMKKDKADGRSSGAAIEKFLDEVKPIKN
ncbi:hypothetical protein NXV68_07520 [Bacteroides fragilis]|nr:hypothetical protein [Bacteroides fragilis]